MFTVVFSINSTLQSSKTDTDAYLRIKDNTMYFNFVFRPKITPWYLQVKYYRSMFILMLPMTMMLESGICFKMMHLPLQSLFSMMMIMTITMMLESGICFMMMHLLLQSLFSLL